MDDGIRARVCAIYTRKSTEEGLEQSFNTLEAQREAGEAYIASQRHAGWTVRAARYDDGGYTGASLERPALKQLLEDIGSGEIGCVVVYKVDRLSRSLLDFARLMGLFERHGVNFVSVTQEFNTTSSLGRLTLNILLSFAQFERELISERTRDKLSAARRKGKWIGGIPVLGYDVDPKGGRLVVNPAEAEQVRDIFGVAAATGSLQQAVRELERRGLRTKSWTSAGGRRHEGRPWSKGRLRALLSNVLYRGDISHKGAVWPGEQEAIVDPALWERVNAQLDEKSLHQRGRAHRKGDCVLRGMLYCGQCGAEMKGTYTRRRGVLYRYDRCPSARGKVAACSQRQPIATVDIEQVLRGELGLTSEEPLSRMRLEEMVERITWRELGRQLRIEYRDGTRTQVELPRPTRPGVRKRGLTEGAAPVARLSRLMALAIHLEEQKSGGEFRDWAEIARLGRISRARLSQIASLLNLAPEIQERLLYLPPSARRPDGIGERRVREIAGHPDWEWQRKLFHQLLSQSEH